MIFPIGHEKTTVRRLPWISIGLIVLNVAVFLVFLSAPSRGRADASGAFENVCAYLSRHPYLEPPDPFKKFLSEVTGDPDPLAPLRTEGDGRPAALSPSGRETEQEELQRRVDSFFEAFYDSFPGRYGHIPARQSLRRIVTSTFVHGDWMHLLGNMLFFYLTGPFLEDVYGRPLFVAFYLLGAIASALAHAASNPESLIPCVGASGAIAALMGAFLVRFASIRIRFVYFFSLVLRGTFTAPAFVMLPLWFFQQLFFHYFSRGTSNVAFLAHIAGFVFGVAFAGAIKFFGVEERFIRPRLEGGSSVSGIGSPVRRAVQPPTRPVTGEGRIGRPVSLRSGAGDGQGSAPPPKPPKPTGGAASPASPGTRPPAAAPKTAPPRPEFRKPDGEPPQPSPQSFEIKRHVGDVLCLEEAGLSVRVDDRTGTVKWEHIRVAGACRVTTASGTRVVVDLAVATTLEKIPLILRLKGELLHCIQGLESANNEVALKKLFHLLKTKTPCDLLPTAESWDLPRPPIMSNESSFNQAFHLALEHLKKRG